MTLRRAVGWTSVGLLAVVGVIALAAAEGRWRVRALDERAMALVAAGEYVAAARVLLEAVAVAPGDARAHYYLGLAYAGIGLCAAALSQFQEAVRLAPDFDHAVECDRNTGGAQ